MASRRFIATTLNIDTDEGNPTAKFLLHILAAFAELEREMIRKRVRTGLRTAKANGKALGRPGPGATRLLKEGRMPLGAEASSGIP